MLRRTALLNTLLKERQREEYVTGRRRRIRKELVDVLTEKEGYCKLEEEALDRTQCKTRFGRCHGPVIRQTVVYNGYGILYVRKTPTVC
jgi:hypothetical protein